MKPAPILLADDNEGDVFLIRRALEASHIEELTVVRNGEEVVHLLEQAQPGGPAALPRLILLDVNLPRVDGIRILEIIRTTPSLAAIPVITLSSSVSDNDREIALAKGANVYFRKPMDLDAFMQLGSVVEEVLDRFPQSAAGAAGAANE